MYGNFSLPVVFVLFLLKVLIISEMAPRPTAGRVAVELSNEQAANTALDKLSGFYCDGCCLATEGGQAVFLKIKHRS